MASRPDSVAMAALGQDVIRPRWFAYLDFVGDPVRATTWVAPVAFSSTGDPDLDGFTFEPVHDELVTIGTPQFSAAGSETLPITLSGLTGPNSDLLNILGDETKWRGRSARLWQMVVDDTGAQQGVVWSYYTGWMSAMSIAGDASQQTVAVDIEGYIASLSPASNRTYLDATSFDAADTSAEAAIAAMNGAHGLAANISPGAGGLTGAQRFEYRYNLS